MYYLRAFLVGGLICLIAQILIDKTKMTAARILVMFVVFGAILSGLGIYEHLVGFAKCGSTVPIIGFGHALVRGTRNAIKESGCIGIFTGGISQVATGLSASIFFGFLAALLFNPKEK